MPHPLMFEEDDPILARVRQLALALPGAQEKISVGHPAFYTKKVFAWYAMSHKQGGVWTRNPQSVSLFLPHDLTQALLRREEVYVPGYIGPFGWVALRLGPSTNWEELEELMRESFRQTAPARLVRSLDAE